ncbi:hypothetical protein GNAINCEL_00111 [Serratia phage KKP 3709]|nr:hypothetical protein GNAINCEL_00111 [Serratia phage KKP 3709]
MKKYDELFTAKVKQFKKNIYPFDFKWTVLLRKTRLHFIDSQRVVYDINTGIQVGITAHDDEDQRPKIDLRTVTLFPDPGLPGAYKLHKFTHNVMLCYKAANHRIVSREIHVRVNSRWAVDMYGRRFNKKTGECFDDATIWIDVKTATPWRLIYE